MTNQPKRLPPLVRDVVMVFATMLLMIVVLLGWFRDTARHDHYMRDVTCNEACKASLRGHEPRAGFVIELVRPILICEYDSFYMGMLTQIYWAGPWYGPELSPLPNGVTPPTDYWGEPLLDAPKGKNGEPLCPRHFNLKYGQRGFDQWKK